MIKILLAFAVAYAGWWLWQGPKKVWTNGGRGPGRPSDLPRDEGDALRVLGLDAGAGEDDIRAAHRRLLLAVHPDRGGSADLTQRINAARDTLLRRND
jgi:DnaJ homolog subfamily C member 19